MIRFVALVMALILVNPGSIFAVSPKKKEGKRSHAQAIDVFADADREAARGYFLEKHGRGNCPPGLAKKHNGCLPPGQAKKRYVVGKKLPRGIVVEAIPAELSVRLTAPPTGYSYGMVDGDLVKLAVGTMLVLDAIEGLVQ